MSYFKLFSCCVVKNPCHFLDNLELAFTNRCKDMLQLRLKRNRNWDDVEALLSCTELNGAHQAWFPPGKPWAPAFCSAWCHSGGPEPSPGLPGVASDSPECPSSGSALPQRDPQSWRSGPGCGWPPRSPPSLLFPMSARQAKNIDKIFINVFQLILYLHV